MRSWARAIFFRKPDGTPWVKSHEWGYPSLSPVTQAGRMVQWAGRQDNLAHRDSVWTQYIVLKSEHCCILPVCTIPIGHS